MQLAYWNSVWFDGEYCPSSGKIRRRLLRKARKDNNGYLGYFSTERPLLLSHVFALYLENDILYFQAGGCRWSLDQPGLAFQFDVLSSSLLSRFQVVESGRITFTITYLHLIRWFNANIDPTYDLLEFENDHFLSFVASTALRPEWQSIARTKWGEAQ